ncbi:MAG TPA: efflux RND transporter permease subunit [Chondromyces sp.]|nr:efflux RND transporter permease subunit [Chondromyces sp.]
MAAVLAPTLGTEFLPTMDEGSIVVQPFQIPSVSLDQALRTVALIESTIMELPEGDRRTDVVVRLPRSFAAEVENLRDLPLASPTGQRVLLREVADVAVVEGPAQISREDGKRRVVVELNVVGRDIGGFVEEAERRLREELVLPTGSFATWGGQFEQQQRAMARLRPVLMTAATTALGLAPMVWASGVGSEVQRPLTVVVVSGVLTSTLLTLMVLPVLYLRFGRAGSGE